MTSIEPSPATPMSVADYRVWSPGALAAVVAVSSVVFAGGNSDAVAHSPLATLGSNFVLTAAIFGLVAGFARLIDRRFLSFVSIAMVMFLVAVLAAGRGVALWGVMRAVGIDNGSNASEMAIVSVAVFGAGFLLTVLAVNGVTQWRRLQARVRQRDQQRRELRVFLAESISSHTDNITQQLRHHLQSQFATLRSSDSTLRSEVLSATVRAVVRPMAQAVHREFPTVVLPPVATVLVSAKEFFRLTIRGTPFAPLITGALFSLGLSPRNLADGVSLNAVLWTVVVGAVVTSGVWLVNVISKHLLRPLSLAVHATSLFGLLTILGLGIAHLPALADPQAGSPTEYYLVGPIATVLMAVLVGGVVNAKRYLQSQEKQLLALNDDLNRELSQARAVLWRRNQTLATILHGSLQSLMNAAAIRLAHARSDDAASEIIDELAGEVDAIIHSLGSPNLASSNLDDTIANITATWEDIAHITWQVEDEIVELVSGTPTEQAIADCLIEAVYNGIKHQSPERISVTLITSPPDQIILSVTHPGRITDPVSPGLGTEIFDYLTMSHSLTEKDGFVEFRGVFARPASHRSQAPPVADFL